MKSTMAYSWDELIAHESGSQVSRLRSLRPTNPEFFQYVNSDGQEITAVHTLEPYGSLTDRAFTAEHDRLHLLRAVEAGEDYVTFEVPIDTLTLKAATLGTGWRRARLMEPVYEELGNIVRETAKDTGLPPLKLGDIALQRAVGQIVFIPALDFENASSDPKRALNSIKASLQDELGSIFRPHNIYRFERCLDGVEAQT